MKNILNIDKRILNISGLISKNIKGLYSRY